jgi:multidrug efflux system membrane fusion protein
LAVPSQAVRHGQDQLYVYVVKPDATVARKLVEIERDDGVTAIIKSGLEEGQMAVTEGQSRLQEGTHVTIINASPKEAANPPRQGG